jgi:hypothetical protein
MSHQHQLTLVSPNVKHTSTLTSSNLVSRPVSRTSSRAASRDTSLDLFSSSLTKSNHGSRKLLPGVDDNEDDDDDDDEHGMDDRHPPLHRQQTDGRSHQPLLHKDDEERGRPGYDTSPGDLDRPPMFSRRSTMRSRSPDTQAKLATRKRYTYAAFFLGLSLISFVVQTETAVYIQHELGWNKAYCML